MDELTKNILAQNTRIATIKERVVKIGLVFKNFEV